VFTMSVRAFLISLPTLAAKALTYQRSFFYSSIIFFAVVIAFGEIGRFDSPNVFRNILSEDILTRCDPELSFAPVIMEHFGAFLTLFRAALVHSLPF